VSPGLPSTACCRNTPPPWRNRLSQKGWKKPLSNSRRINGRISSIRPSQNLYLGKHSEPQAELDRDPVNPGHERLLLLPILVLFPGGGKASSTPFPFWEPRRKYRKMAFVCETKMCKQRPGKHVSPPTHTGLCNTHPPVCARFSTPSITLTTAFTSQRQKKGLQTSEALYLPNMFHNDFALLPWPGKEQRPSSATVSSHRFHFPGR
jgi:hypothetical protein